MPVAVKRVYEKASRKDGARVLVDRLWPRGVSKQAAALDLWLRDIAPSDRLRRGFHAHRAAWLLFTRKYLKELRQPQAAAALELLYALKAKRSQVTLLYASRDEEHNHAHVLKNLMEGMKKPPTGTGPARAARQRAVRRR
jgi:uncharacterized protein YeaO (DUF488 family)